MNKLLWAAVALTMATTVNAETISPEIKTLLDEVAQNATRICIWEEKSIQQCFQDTYLDVIEIRRQATAECWKEEVCLEGATQEWIQEHIQDQDKRVEEIAVEIQETLLVWT